MWKRFLLLVTSFLSNYASTNAQIATYQTKLRDSTLAILYVGIDNAILIDKIPGNSKVKFDNEYINPIPTNFNPAHPHEKIFVVRVDKPGINKLHILNSRNKEIYAKEYNSKRINDLKVQLGYIKSTEATVNEILLRPSVICYSPECHLKNLFRLGSYRITMQIASEQETKEISDFDLNDKPFDKDIQNKITRMKKGDKIFIDDVRIVGDNNTTRIIPPIKVTIR